MTEIPAPLRRGNPQPRMLKAYVVTRTWENSGPPVSSISVAVVICATCVVLYAPSVARVDENPMRGGVGQRCARCGVEIRAEVRG